MLFSQTSMDRSVIISQYFILTISPIIIFYALLNSTDHFFEKSKTKLQNSVKIMHQMRNLPPKKIFPKQVGSEKIKINTRT